MKKLTIISILLTAVALVAVGCTSQEAATPSTTTQTQLPTSSAELPSVDTGTQGRSAIEAQSAEPAGAIEAADPTLQNNTPYQALPESGTNPPALPSTE
ncbi:hypothetical protein EC844_11686 [Acinetobacter calcoaceticus]|uniref:Lipoprotein n=1 Tax=Acinetobacter calcoaceticus TaxID=471 RepID=A0A4R1XZJ4_ACICA|nr:hypothetical protein EC844_11686 [Acinetobacter calcoaceticus]